MTVILPKPSIPDSNHQNRVTLYAHRGSTVLAPENTLPAFELALRYRADILEIDVRLSRDNQVVVIHDSRVDRTCNGSGLVRNMSLSELQTLDAAHHFRDLDGAGCNGTGVRLLSLQEMFERFPDTPINIDIKDNAPEAAAALARTIENCGRTDNVNVGSFHASVLNHFRTLVPAVTTAATQAEVAQLYFKRGMQKNIGYQYLQIPTQYYGIPLASRSFINHANQRGIKTVFWTINNESAMKQLISRKVDGFVTDRIDIASRLLGRHTP